MKHGWRQPAFSSDPSGPSDRPAWVMFVCDSHLEWLLSFVPIRTTLGRELPPELLMAGEDVERYTIIKEQAEEIMAQADAEGWTEEERYERMIDAGWKKNRVTP